MTVRFVQYGWDAVHSCPRQRDRGCVAARGDDELRWIFGGELTDRAPSTGRAEKCAPVVPRRSTIERMQIQQHERKFCRRQNVLFDTALRANKERCNLWRDLHERARNRQSWIEVSTGTATGKKDSHLRRAYSDADVSGSVAFSPYTRSRELPMFTRIPVITSVRTRFDRP